MCFYKYHDDGGVMTDLSYRCLRTRTVCVEPPPRTAPAPGPGPGLGLGLGPGPGTPQFPASPRGAGGARAKTLLPKICRQQQFIDMRPLFVVICLPSPPLKGELILLICPTLPGGSSHLAGKGVTHGKRILLARVPSLCVD